MTQQNSSYKVLLRLPLFNGMSSEELHEVVACIPFHFQKHKENQVIATQGDTCKELFFLLQGTLKSTSASPNNSYFVTEILSAPNVLPIEELYGLTPRFMATYQTQTSCNILSLHKDNISKLMEISFIFRTNFLNMLSTITQKQRSVIWSYKEQNLNQQILQFFEQHMRKSIGEKHIFISMEVLGKILKTHRMDISKALKHMQKQGLLVLSRGKIYFPSFEKALQQML